MKYCAFISATCAAIATGLCLWDHNLSESVAWINAFVWATAVLGYES